MASPNIIGSTYAGGLLRPYVARTILRSRTFESGIATITPNIQGMDTIRKVDATINFADNTMDFTPVDGVILEQVTLQPIRMSVQLQYNKDELYTSWEAMLMQAGIDKQPLPQELEAAIMEVVGGRIGAGMENLCWNGKSSATQWAAYSFTGNIAGWVAEARAFNSGARRATTGARGTLALSGITNAGVVTVSSTANLQTDDYVTFKVGVNGNQQFGGSSIVGQTFSIAVLTGTTFQLINPVNGANATLTGSTAATSGDIGFINQYSVQEALSIAWRQTPNQVRIPNTNVDRPIIYVSPDVMIAYKNSIAQSMSLQAGYTNTRTDVWADELNDTWNGNRVTVIPGMQPNVVFVAQPSNLRLGLSALSDKDTLNMYDFSEQLGNKVGFRADFSAIAKLLWPGDTSIVTPFIPAS